ncbi:hypothetical protein HMPREF2800_01685 [Anaerosphaera sp. HMSC064C01]|nr:hypothetical protein HMPREF2800_01685 [Anaerosphaera sp. HMSC064C01]
MKRKSKFILALVLMLVFSTVVFAARKVNITVTYDNIKVVVDGREVQFGKDTKGKQIEPFIYNGTTYLPLRAVAEAVGKEVKWDQNTKTAFLGDGTVDMGEVNKPLTEIMKPFSTEKAEVIAKDEYKTKFSLGGKEYNNGILFNSYTYKKGHANFNLEGKYTNLTGLLGADQEGLTVKVDFIGDGKLIQSFDVVGGQLPVNVNLNVTGVRLLEIKFEWTDGLYSTTYTGFADAFVK